MSHNELHDLIRRLPTLPRGGESMLCLLEVLQISCKTPEFRINRAALGTNIVFTPAQEKLRVDHHVRYDRVFGNHTLG